MAKDYKNTPKPKDKKPKAAPGWLWLLAGLSIGLFVALLVYLKDYQKESGGRTKPAPVVEKGRAAPKPADKATEKASEDTAQKPRFDFYNLLPEMEVFIPEQDIAAERERTPKEKVNYFLQVGSFRQFEDADRLRAQLALMNLESHIQRVTVDGKAGSVQTWHRVRVGPYTSAREMDKIRNRLRAEAMEPIVLKRKEK
jgi:cell division protein FtsN